MSTTITRVETIEALGRDEARNLAATEYERFATLLRSLSAADWSKPTDCTKWTVKDIVAHVNGMAAAMTSFREMLRQQKAGKGIAKREGLSAFDGWTEYQVRTFAQARPADLASRYEEVVPAVRFVRGRTTPLRLVRFPSPPYGWFSMAYLRDDILTRDIWMHRVDISRATEREVEVDARHDGRFVANIVRELAARWKQPFNIALEGPAGGTFVNGNGGITARLDAVEFCRILSGRATGHGLPTDVVPF